MRLYLVRHGRPEFGTNVCYGSTDLPVPAEEDARVLAHALPLLPRGAVVYASPLRRCAGLARLLLDAGVGSRMVLDARLREMDFGGWEMRPWDQVAREEVDAWVADLPHYRPGGGESVMQAARRVQAFDRELSTAGHADAVIVCHAGTMRLLLQLRQGLPLAEAALRAAGAAHRIGYGEVIALDAGGSIAG